MGCLPSERASQQRAPSLLRFELVSRAVVIPTLQTKGATQVGLSCRQARLLVHRGLGQSEKQSLTVSKVRMAWPCLKAETSNSAWDSGVGVGTKTFMSCASSELYFRFTSAQVKRL